MKIYRKSMKINENLQKINENLRKPKENQGKLIGNYRKSGRGGRDKIFIDFLLNFNKKLKEIKPWQPRLDFH